MNSDVLALTECLVSISDFSQGKAGKIFSEVAKNNKEYIVLKNNQPIAVLLSIKEYREIQEKIWKMQKRLEKTENIKALEFTENRLNNPTL